jgi:hypothetical protein
MESASSTTVLVNPEQQPHHPSAAKYFLKATANSTTVNVSYNVTSVGDTATGRMTINLTTAFSSTHWCGIVTLQVTQANNSLKVSSISQGTLPGVSSVVMESWLIGATTEALTDPSFWNSAGYGDQ